jgi:hypothetical protein
MSLKHVHDNAEYLDILSVSKNSEWCNHGMSHIDVNPSISLFQVCCKVLIHIYEKQNFIIDLHCK